MNFDVTWNLIRIMVGSRNEQNRNQYISLVSGIMPMEKSSEGFVVTPQNASKLLSKQQNTDCHRTESRYMYKHHIT